MRARLRPAVLACAIANLAVACTSVGSAVKKEGPAAKATLDALAQAAKDLETRPPVTSDVVTASGAMVLDASDPSAGDVLVTYVEDLAARGELGNVTPRLNGTSTVAACASILDHETHPWDPRSPEGWNAPLYGDDAEKTLQACGRARYALVVRTTEVALPRNLRAERRAPGVALPGDAGVTDGGTRDAGARDAGARGKVVTPGSLALLDAGARSAPDAGAPAAEVWLPSGSDDLVPARCTSADVRCRFDGGYLKAEVHLYALKPFAHQGAFVFEAENGTNIQFSSYATPGDLERDFQKSARAAFAAALKKNLPNASARGLE